MGDRRLPAPLIQPPECPKPRACQYCSPSASALSSCAAPVDSASCVVADGRGWAEDRHKRQMSGNPRRPPTSSRKLSHRPTSILDAPLRNRQLPIIRRYVNSGGAGSAPPVAGGDAPPGDLYSTRSEEHT